ncbi:MAG: hypothetical protein AAFV47_05435 [Pseudomonadota bacterium]
MINPRNVFLAGACLLGIVQQPVIAQDTSTLNGGLSEEEMEASPEDGTPALSLDVSMPATSADEVSSFFVTPMARGGYLDADGRLVVDLLEGNTTFLALQVMSEEGVPVSDAVAEFEIEGTSTVRAVDPSANGYTTDEYGITEFVVLAGDMGLDVITAKVGDTETEIAINVISLAALSAPALPVVEGAITWDELRSVRLTYEDSELLAAFPASIAERADETVKITGFMTPLEADSSQRWFLLTSSPPHCFFDIPGGPAGTVEVLAPDGVELSWDPVVVEGRFEPIERGKGTVYRLHDAKLITPAGA